MTPLFPSYRDFQRLEFKVDAALKQLGVVIRHEDFLIHMENENMTTAADIKAQSETLLAEVRKESDQVTAIKTLVQGQNDTINELNQELKEAIANGADKDTLQAISDNIAAATAAVDANLAAEAAVANTTPPAAPPAAVSHIADITSITPLNGTVAGGDTVTISGNGFNDVQAVTFGGIPAQTFSPADSGATLNVTVPPSAAPGVVDIIVTTTAGDSAPTPFTYTPAPAEPTV